MATHFLNIAVVSTMFILGSCTLLSGPPNATPADKLSLLRREDVQFFLGVDREKYSILPIEGQEYKCQILRALYSNARATYRGRPEQGVLSSQMRRMLKDCGHGEFRMIDFFNGTFTFPGTKWCGQGNIAENYHDLGTFNETDACCRDHDLCDDIIQPGRTKHNLINPYGTTRLHCKCDDVLRQCFRNVRSVIANTVGYIFFSLLQTQCFDFNYPTIGCEQWRRGAVRMYCVKYELNTSEPKKWQWFDQEPFF